VIPASLQQKQAFLENISLTKNQHEDGIFSVSVMQKRCVRKINKIFDLDFSREITENEFNAVLYMSKIFMINF
jgi:hypothetical protein